MASILRRGLLYVPGSSMKMLQKSQGLTVDCIAYDLEDSVTLEKKPEARSNLRNHLGEPRPRGIHEQAVRINAIDSGFALNDLTEVLQAPNLDAIVIPKVTSASDLHFVTDVIRHAQPERHSSSSPNNDATASSKQPPIRLIALIESAKAILNLPSICAASPYLSGLIFAAEDFVLDLSISRTPSLTEFLYARSAIATAARAYNLPSTIDLVCTHYRGEQGLKILGEECRGGKTLGFNGKQLIHPSQVETCQRVFSPEESEVEWAVRVMVANAKAREAGRGAWTLDSKMIDAPVIGIAEALMRKAELCGFDMGALKEKWREQEPE